jgi:glutamyl/glutaminyl-tRNA synthetase
MPEATYRGRIAPSPTGYLHVGHMRTFWIAFERARAAGGALVLRNEDLDPQRSRPQFAESMIEDLRWFGIGWDEGPDIGGSFAPYEQSRRRDFYVDAWRRLRDGGFIYPCTCSRKDLAESAQAPHEGAAHDPNDEPVYPGTCRQRPPDAASPAGVHWRFRVPDGETVTFDDLHLGRLQFRAGFDFGDFVVWRRDDVPAYQLAVVVDDAAMQISEIVRGADLLKSTVRQILLQRALGLPHPRWYHCDLVTDDDGVRLAKRHDALSIRALRAAGKTPQQIRAGWRPVTD